MKLLLTSGGLTNKSISDALLNLVGKPFSETKLVFIPTAANFERGDKSWLINDLNNIKKEGFKEVDIVDISALPKKHWIKVLQEKDVIFVGGGNTFHLMYWIEKSGLKEILPELLKTKVYVGLSAGSCVMGPKILTPLQSFYPDEENEHNITAGLNVVSFHVLPHLNSDYFKDLREEKIKEKAKLVKETIYVIDDQTAIIIEDNNIEIITEGKYIKYN